MKTENSKEEDNIRLYAIANDVYEKEKTVQANLIDEFKSQKAILARLFDEDWFKKDIDKKVNHPAYKKWSLSVKIIEQKGAIRYPEDNISDIASIIIDNFSIVKCSNGDTDKFIYGTFSEWDNEEFQKRMKTEMQDPDKFYDKLLELSYAAWHKSIDNKVISYEGKEGYPDFKINIKDVDLPIVVDCKRIKANTKDNAFGKDINKGNNQIKKLNEDCYGIVVIDISDRLRKSDIEIYSRDKISNLDTNKIPEEVNRIKNIVQSAISNDNSSVSGVLLIWNDAKIFGLPGISPISSFVNFNRSIVVRHLNPKKKLPEEPNLSFESTFICNIWFNPVYITNSENWYNKPVI